MNSYLLFAMVIAIFFGPQLIFKRIIQKSERQKPSLCRKLTRLTPFFRGLSLSLFIAGFLFGFFGIEDHLRQISLSNLTKVYDLNKCLRLMLACAGGVGFISGEVNINNRWAKLAGAFVGFCIGSITLIIADKFCSLSISVLICVSVGFTLIGSFLLFVILEPLEAWQKKQKEEEGRTQEMAFIEEIKRRKK